MLSGQMNPERKKRRKVEMHKNLRIFMIFSHIFLISTGFALVLVGFLTILISKILSHQHSDSRLLLTTGTCQVGLGVSLLLVGIFGCVASYFYSYSYLEGYSYLMILCGVSYFAFAIFQILTYQIMIDWTDKRVVKLQIEASETISWKYLQSAFGCCGFNTYSEWFNTSSRLWIPIECCKPEEGLSQVARVVDEHRCLDEVNKLPVESEHFYTKGCKMMVKGIVSFLSVTMNIFSLFVLFLLNVIVIASRKISGVV